MPTSRYCSPERQPRDAAEFFFINPDGHDRRRARVVEPLRLDFLQERTLCAMLFYDVKN
jgi:hypothetical protein